MKSLEFQIGIVNTDTEIAAGRDSNALRFHNAYVEDTVRNA